MTYPTAFRRAALLEGLTLILLVGVGVPLKHIYNVAEVVRWVGPVHGFFFLWYCYQLLQLRAENLVDRKRAALLFLAAFLPGGTIFAVRESP